MQDFSITVAVDVPAYAIVSVPANTPEDAHRIVQASLERDGWASPYFEKAVFKPEWGSATQLRALEP